MGRGSTDGDGSQVLFGDFARRGGTPKERWEQVSELQLLLRDRDDESHARLLALLETLDLGPEDLDESGAAELTEYVRQDGVQLKKHVIDVQILLGDRPDESENGELRRRLQGLHGAAREGPAVRGRFQ